MVPASRALNPANNPRVDARSNADVEADLRAAAEAAGAPLSHVMYDKLRRAGSISAVRVMQRYDTWVKACRAAGIEPGVTHRSYQRRWTLDELVAAVRRYLESKGARGSYADYDRWSKADVDRPSAQTIRNGLGSWNAAKALALEEEGSAPGLGGDPPAAVGDGPAQS